MIVDVMWVYQNSSRLVYVMEYLESGSLADMIKSNVNEKKHLSEIDAILYIKEIICAIEYLHSEGTILGHLPPDHVLLENDGHIKL